jgi:hypothetical protein
MIYKGAKLTSYKREICRLKPSLNSLDLKSRNNHRYTLYHEAIPHICIVFKYQDK